MDTSPKKGWSIFKRSTKSSNSTHVHQFSLGGNEDVFTGWGEETLSTLLKPCLDMLLNGFEFFVGTDPGQISFVSQLSSILRDVQTFLLEEPEEYDSLDSQNRTPWTGDQVQASWEGFMEALLEQCKQRFGEEKSLLSDSGLVWVAPSLPFQSTPLPHRDEVLRHVSRAVWGQYKAHLLGLQATAITEVHKIVDFEPGPAPDMLLDVQWCHSSDPAVIQSLFGPGYHVIGGGIMAVDGRPLYLCGLLTSSARKVPEVITGLCFIHSSGIAAPEVPLGFEVLLRASDKLSACLALQLPKVAELETPTLQLKNKFRSRSPTSLRSILPTTKKEEVPKIVVEKTPESSNKLERLQLESDAYADFFYGDLRGLTQRLIKKPEPEVGIYLCVARGDGPPIRLPGLASRPSPSALSTPDQKEPPMTPRSPVKPRDSHDNGSSLAVVVSSASVSLRMVNEIGAGEHAILSSIEGCASDVILHASRTNANLTFKPDINSAIYLFSQYILRKNVAVTQREAEIQSNEMKVDNQAVITALSQFIARDRALVLVSKTLLCLTASMYCFSHDIVKQALACFKHLSPALLHVTDSDPWFELDGRGWPSVGRAVCLDLFIESVTRACLSLCVYVPDSTASEISHYMLEVMGFITEQYTPYLTLHAVGCLIETYFLYVRTDAAHQLSNALIEHSYKDQDAESEKDNNEDTPPEIGRAQRSGTLTQINQQKLSKDEMFYYSRIRRWAGRGRWGSGCAPKLRTSIIQYVENLNINDDSTRRLSYLVIFCCCVIETAPAPAKEDFSPADEFASNNFSAASSATSSSSGFNATGTTSFSPSASSNNLHADLKPEMKTSQANGSAAGGGVGAEAPVLENMKVKLHAMNLLKGIFGHQLRARQGATIKHIDLTVIRRFVIPLCTVLASYPDTLLWEKCLEVISVIWADFYYRSHLLDEMGILLESWRVLLECPNFPPQQKLVLLNRLVGDIYFSSEVSAEVLWNYDYYLTLPESLQQMNARSDFTSVFDAGSVYVNLINSAINVCAAQSVVETDGGAEHSVGANLRHNSLFFVTNCFLLCAKLLYIDDKLPTAESSERETRDRRNLNGLFGVKKSSNGVLINKSNIDIQVANSHSMLKEVKALLEKADNLVKAEAPLNTIGVFLKGACDQVFLCYGTKQKEAKLGRIFAEFLLVNSAQLPSVTVFELLSASSSSDPSIQWGNQQEEWLSRAELDFIRQEYLCYFDLAGMSIDLALRYFFARSTLILPATFFDSDPRDHLLLSCFCHRFVLQNPEWPKYMFSQEEIDSMVITSDAPNTHTVALNLTCGLLEISARRSDATGASEFLEGCQDLGLPLSYLKDLYRRTKLHPIISTASSSSFSAGSSGGGGEVFSRPSKHLRTIVDRSNNGLMRSFYESFRGDGREPAKPEMNENEKRELAQVMFTQTWQGAFTIVKNIGESTIDQTALQLTIYGATHALTVARGLRFNQQEEMFADLLIILRRRVGLLELREAARTAIISPGVNLVRSHSIAHTSYKNCVMGKELVDFIVSRPKARKTAATIDRARAIQIGQNLMEHKLGLKSIAGGTKFEDNNNLYFFDTVQHKPDSLTKDPGMTNDSSSSISVSSSSTSGSPSSNNSCSATQNLASLVPQHSQSSAELIDGLNHPLLGIKVLRAKGMRGVFAETYCSIRFIDAKGYFLEGLTRKTCISRDRQNPSWLWEPELMILINPALYNPVHIQVAVYGSRMGKHRLQGCVNVPMESLGKNWVTQWRVLHKADGTASGGGSIQIRMRLRPPDDRFGSIPPMNTFDTALMLALRPAVVSGCEDTYEEKKQTRDVIQQRLLERRKTVAKRLQELEASEEDIPEQWETSRTGRFLFTDHSPATFRKLRSLFRGGDDEDYIASMCKGPICSVGESKGKSGASFYKTWDGRFFLKTLRPSESLLLMGDKRGLEAAKPAKDTEELEDSFLNSFIVFFKRNPDSFIQRFYACFTIAFLGENSNDTAPGSATQTHTIQRSFVVINNVFDTPLEIHATFDLKGSTQGRQVSDKERKEHEDKALIQKDLDFKRSQADCALPKPQREVLLAQLQRDCQFLEGFDIMDYSLLLGLHRIKDGVVPPLGPGLVVRPGAPIRTIAGHYLFAGIIDVLQTYNIAKKLETTVKSIPFSKQAISCVAPELYAARFFEFMKTSLSEPPEGVPSRRGSTGTAALSTTTNGAPTLTNETTTIATAVTATGATTTTTVVTTTTENLASLRGVDAKQIDTVSAIPSTSSTVLVSLASTSSAPKAASTSSLVSSSSATVTVNATSQATTVQIDTGVAPPATITVPTNISSSPQTSTLVQTGNSKDIAVPVDSKVIVSIGATSPSVIASVSTAATPAVLQPGASAVESFAISPIVAAIPATSSTLATNVSPGVTAMTLASSHTALATRPSSVSASIPAATPASNLVTISRSSSVSSFPKLTTSSVPSSNPISSSAITSIVTHYPIQSSRGSTTTSTNASSANSSVVPRSTTPVTITSSDSSMSVGDSESLTIRTSSASTPATALQTTHPASSTTKSSIPFAATVSATAEPLESLGAPPSPMEKRRPPPPPQNTRSESEIDGRKINQNLSDLEEY